MRLTIHNTLVQTSTKLVERIVPVVYFRIGMRAKYQISGAKASTKSILPTRISGVGSKYSASGGKMSIVAHFSMLGSHTNLSCTGGYTVTISAMSVIISNLNLTFFKILTISV